MSVRRIRSAVSAVLLLATAAAAQQPDDARLTVAVEAPERAWVQQPVTVRVVIAWDREWFATSSVPLFRERVDVPCHVDVPWLRAEPGRAVGIERVADAQQRVSVVVGDRVVDARALADETRDGRTFARAELRCRWLPLVDGEQTMQPLRLRYAFATEFREHLLRGREPVDRQDATVSSQPRTLRVDALPKPAPAGFTGAVGEFELHATSGGERVHVGDAFRIEVTVTGDGNVERFAGLGQPSLDGFHVDGIAERDAPVGRRFELDLVALREGVAEVPPVSLLAFSPARGDYVTLTAEPVPVLVDPLPEGRVLDERVQELVDADRAARAPGWPTWALRGGLVALVLVGAWLSRRAVRGHGRRAVEQALHELRIAVLAPGGEAVEAERIASRFERLLVVVAGGGRGPEDFAVPGTWDRLRNRGVAPDGLDELQRLHELLDAARFGGPLPEAERIMAPAETLATAAR